MAGSKKPKKGRPGNTAAAVWKLAQPIAESLGLMIWDIRFVKQGALWYLRIFIDKPGGVGIEDCEAMSRAVNGPLDELDPIDGSYCLEVSSPGINRELTRPEHFEACINDLIRVKLIRPRDGKKEFIVGLDGYDKEKLYCHEVDDEGMALEAVEFALKECASINLYDDDIF